MVLLTMVKSFRSSAMEIGHNRILEVIHAFAWMTFYFSGTTKRGRKG